VNIKIKPVTKENWEEVLKLELHSEQKKFAPTPAESLAAAYIKPWDEALDPFLLYNDDALIGIFYISYTPDSADNYWIGGFIIDKKFQRQGLGRASLLAILKWMPTKFPKCKSVNLTVEKDNTVAQALYKSLGFSDTGEVNKYGEIVYELPVI